MKFNIKIFLTAVLILLSSAVLFGCGGCRNGVDTDGSTSTGPNDGGYLSFPIPDIDDDSRLEIIDAAYEKYADQLTGYTAEDVSIRYFGTYDDAVALFLDLPGIDYSDTEHSETVGGLVFKYDSTQTLKIYYKNDFFELQSALDSGALSQEGLENLHFVYTSYLNALTGNVPSVTAPDETTAEPYIPTFPSYDDIMPPEIIFPVINYDYELPALSVEKENEIIEAAYNKHNTHSGLTIDDISIEYYSRFGDSYAVMVNIKGIDYMDVIMQVKIHGYVFIFPSSQMIEIYNNGNFHKLDSDEAENLLSEEEARILHGIYNEQFTLSTEGKKHLESEWEARFGTTIEWYKGDIYKGTRYYGAFNGMPVLFVPVYPTYYADTANDVTIAGNRFTYNTSFELFVYIGYYFISLSDAYEDGLISAEQIAEIAEYHKFFNNFPNNNMIIK